MPLLSGKVAVVTGSGRGIGRAIAIAYAAEGADLVLAARSAAELEAVAAEARAFGRRAIAVRTDVTRRGAVEDLAGAVRTAFGRLDILVNNAGGGLEHKGILDSDPDLWVEDVTVNCVSAYLVSRALLPLMVESGGGRVINVGSGMGHRPTATAALITWARPACGCSRAAWPRKSGSTTSRSTSSFPAPWPPGSRPPAGRHPTPTAR